MEIKSVRKEFDQRSFSPVLYDLLKRADDYYLKTDGRFSPYLLTQLEAHGYDQSFPFETSQNSICPY